MLKSCWQLMIASPHRLLWALLLLQPMAALAADDRPDNLVAAGGNPLELSAMAFLGWYWQMFALLALLAVAVRLVRWAPGDPTGYGARLGNDPYLMAYLAGGPQRVVGAALASLVHQGALRVNAVTKELIAEAELPMGRPQIERDVRAQLSGTQRVSDKAEFQRRMQAALADSLSSMQERLQRAGLLARPLLQRWLLTPVRIGFGLLLLVGVVRMILGIAADRPVGFLLISMVVIGLAALWLLRGIGGERATPAGERLLKECRSNLREGDDQRLWMVSLLGLSSLGMGPLGDLEFLIQELPRGEFGIGSRKQGGDSSAGGSGCGTSGCGGGGCGGGGCGG